MIFFVCVAGIFWWGQRGVPLPYAVHSFLIHPMSNSLIPNTPHKHHPDRQDHQNHLQDHQHHPQGGPGNPPCGSGGPGGGAGGPGGCSGGPGGGPGGQAGACGELEMSELEMG